MAEELDPKSVAWSRDLFNSLLEGGMWGIPRSGLIFQRRGEKLVLVTVMPHDDAMPVSAEQLNEQQEVEYENVAKYFRAAGIIVGKRLRLD